MPYTAQRPSLFNNVGSAAPQGPQVDVPGAIEALTGGAASLIHATMLRKQAENAAAMQRQELALRQQTEKFQQDRAQSEDRYKGAQQDNERQKINDAFLLAGGIRGTPPKPTMVPEATTESVGPLPTPVTPQGPIARSMARGASRDALPAPSLTPSAPPTPAASNPLPAATKLRKSMTAGTPDTVDPTQSSKFVQSVGLEDKKQQGRLTLADVKNTNTTNRDATLEAYKQQNIELAGRVRDRVEAHIAGIKAGTGGKPMTATQRIAAQRFVFGEIGKQANGNPDEAANILSSDGALSDLAKSVGITEAEVRRATAAFGNKVNATTDKEILGVFQSGMAKDIPAAKAAVIGAKTPAVDPKVKPTTGDDKPAAALKPLSDEAKAKARTEPKFAKFLADKGYTDADWGTGTSASMTRRLVTRKLVSDSAKK